MSPLGSLSEVEYHHSPQNVFSLARVLGVDFVIPSTLSFLDHRDILRCSEASRFLQHAASDEGLWRALRDILWEGKAYVPARAKKLPPKAGYVMSLKDSKRSWLTREELTSISWGFRFKQQAGEAWTNQDPWYRNEKTPTVEFKDDHTVHRHGDTLLQPMTNVTWRFVPQSGLRQGPLGSFLRVSIAGREVPTYIVSRHPSNWGFIMESCWTLYTSWKMPPREGPECDRALLDGNLRVTMEDQWEEAMSFNTGLSFEIYDMGGFDGEDEAQGGGEGQGQGQEQGGAAAEEGR